MFRRTLALAFVLFIAAPARADSTNAAQVLFEEGRKLMAEGNLAAACPKFAESQKLDPGAGTLLNLARCYEKREQFASAWETYTEAATAADRAGRAQWRKRAKDKAAALSPRLSTLTIVVPAEAKVDGLVITRDGRQLAPEEWGVKVPIDGGEHDIEATAPGRVSWNTHVTVEAQRAALKVNIPLLTAAPEAAPVQPTSPSPAAEAEGRPATRAEVKPAAQTDIAPSSGSTQRVLGVVAGSVGLVALGVGGYFGIRAGGKHEDARGGCNDAETHCSPQGLIDYGEAKDAATISTIAFVAGAVCLVGGIVLYLTAPRRSTRAAALGGFVF